MSKHTISRRQLLQSAAAGTVSLALQDSSRAEAVFQFEYIVASSMYGRLPIAEVVAEVRKTDAEHIDIWPERHANHREQIEKMGHDAFASLLDKHKVKVGIYTVYNPGLHRCQPWMPVAKKFGGTMLIANAGINKKVKGDAAKKAVAQYIERLKPVIARAEELDLLIGVENHSGSFVNQPENQTLFLDMVKSERVGIALAPYHIGQDSKMLAAHIEKLGDRLFHFYAWQHGMGCMKKLPKEQELLQMPGRGDLDFTPIAAALKKIKYSHWVQPFMHPVPRGIPILPTASEVSAEINRAQKYLEKCLKRA